VLSADRPISRRAFFGVAAYFVFGVLLVFRLPQVLTYVLAALVRRQWLTGRSLRPSATLDDWAKAGPIVRPSVPLLPLALVTYHPWYHAYDPSVVVECLRRAADLRCQYVRSDIRWSDVLPDGALPDAKAVSWYRQYLLAMKELGLKPFLVLSNPPQGISDLPAEEKLKAWSRFVDLVTDELGTVCDRFQLMNEPNNPAYRIFSGSDLRDGLVYAARSLKAKNPDTKVAVNVALDLPNWDSQLEEILAGMGDAAHIDLIGLDHYPGTWSLGFGDNWEAVDETVRKIESAESTSPWYGRQVVIMETGYSSNLPLLRDEQDQADYFRSLQEKLLQLRSFHSASLCLFGVYELADSDSTAILDPEAHFGLLRSDTLGPKQAFESVRALFERIEEARSSNTS
jgi:hypothetical protein